MASNRELLNAGTDQRFDGRDGHGRFEENDDVGRSLTQTDVGMTTPKVSLDKATEAIAAAEAIEPDESTPLPRQALRTFEVARSTESGTPIVRPVIPPHAICFFIEGYKLACVRGDFQNLAESPAGFGDTMKEAFDDLQRAEIRARRSDKKLSDHRVL